MADTDSPKLTMGDENLRAMRFEPSDNPPTRRWTCPDDQTIAAYVDDALSQTRKAGVECHLSGCERCRVIVADVVKLQREVELPATPFELTRRTVQFVPAVSVRPNWIWAPAAAVALIVLITVILSLLREPQQLVVTSPPPPSAPMISKAELPMVHDSPRREVLRRPEVSETLPVILSPQRDSAVVRENLKFNWKPVLRSRYYKISVVTSDGDLLWEGQTEKSTLHLPWDVVLKRGAYFVWITAYLTDGRVAKSSPVRFVIKG
jgi:putative zinc finger protein